MSKRKEQAAVSLDRILQSASKEFSEKGFEGARMDVIAIAAGVNKQAPYHYFSSKEGLFQAVLEHAYQRFRGNHQELAARVADLDAEEALWIFVSSLFKANDETRGFQQLLQDENRFEGRHIGGFDEAKTAYVEILDLLKSIVERGAAGGTFRSDIDVTELYISIGGLFMFRTTNSFTLSTMLGKDVSSQTGATATRKAAFDLLLKALRPNVSKDNPARLGR